MMDLFAAGGVMMWPVLVCALLVVGLTVRASLTLARSRGVASRNVLSASDAVLFWGGLGAVLGLLGTIVGIAQIASMMERFGGAGAATLWSGFRVTLVTSIAGLTTLVVALLLWLALRALHQRGSGEVAEPA